MAFETLQAVFHCAVLLLVQMAREKLGISVVVSADSKGEERVEGVDSL